MASKSFLEIFNKYTPTDDSVIRILSSAQNIQIRADKEKRILEATMEFPEIVHKDYLYLIENEIKEQYKLSYVKILPKYKSELFSSNYFAQILRETERVGDVALGFFSDCDYKITGKDIEIKIPFSDGGIKLLDNAKTPRLIENILFSEFEEKYNVNIVTDEDSYKQRQQEIELRNKQLEEQIAKSAMMSTSYSNIGSSAKKAIEEKTAFTKFQSVYPTENLIQLSDKEVKIGFSTFDISEPEFVLGSEFNITPTPIAYLEGQSKNLCVIGEVFGFAIDENKRSEKSAVTFYLFDGNTSLQFRSYRNAEDCKMLKGMFEKGGVFAFYGYAKHEVRKDGSVEKDLNFTFSSCAKVKKIERIDTAEKKRVELHLHSQMSTMDGLIEPSKLVETLSKWGYKATAITDHGNVQGFQMALEKSEKLGMKMLYGMEAYYVNDKMSAIVGKYQGNFDDEIIVFDIETTGLSPENCEIIEIGAVKIKQCKVVEVFDKFIKPQNPIPENITALTSITNEMVKDADGVEVVLREFLDFAGDKLLIAHNANFDTSFIRKFSIDCGYEFTNPYLDTVALSRFINTDLKTHKLDHVAKYYGLGDFNHHRASDDAEMLANIFFCMVEKMKKSNINDFSDLDREMNENSDPKKLKSYHMIIFAKNNVGLKNLYHLISDSYLKYYHKNPRIPRSELEELREGLIIGSACEAGELFRAILSKLPENDIADIVSFYDYLEIQPIANNRFLIEEGMAKDDEDLRNLNKEIVALGEKYNKPVVATCDAHFFNPEDEIGRKILLDGLRYKDFDKPCPLYFRTTDEMLEEFSYLGKEKAYEVVVENTNMIADMIDDGMRAFPKGTFTPSIEGSEEDLKRICYENAEAKYGKPLPTIVEERLDKELTSIIKNGFAVLYMIAQKLVWYSESQGYLVGSRGSVGSSFVASCAGISEVNPLKPHYYCPKCKNSEFFVNNEVGSGFDLPDKVCPKCGTQYKADGHDIPFETFLGFHGEKSPDIDLNFSGEVQGKVHKYTEELFGAENVFRAGTIGGLADKTAFGYVLKYLEDKEMSLPSAEMKRLAMKCEGVKKTTGQHPGGIVVVPKDRSIYDFCPVQHPAEDANSDIVTTHFTFEYLHDTLLKLDELGHDIPTKYKWLERFSNTSVMDVPMNDKAVYELFLSTEPLGVSPSDIGADVGTFGLPEFGTRFIQQVLIDSKPKNFADLLQISGLTHGTDVWLGNAQDLIKQGKCTISDVIGCRDGIMLDLIRFGIDSELSFKIMEAVRKGKGLQPEWEEAIKASNAPDWYIGSCKKIKYMFPKAHAAAYVMSAIRLGWYKINMPLVFYAAMFTVSSDSLDAEIIMKGKRGVNDEIKRVEKLGNDASQKEKSSISQLQLVNEAYARGIKFLPVNLKKSDATIFQPENGSIRLPFSTLSGLGENACQNIIKAREKEDFFSIEDLQVRAKLSGTVIEMLKKNGVLDGLDETDQISLF